MQRRSQRHQVLTVGIAGGSGSGKSTLARALARQFPPGTVTLLSQDSYYRSLRGSPHGYNFDHPRALDLGLLCRHLRALRAGRAIRVPQYDFATHQRTGQSIRVEPACLVVVEGTLIFSSRPLRQAFDVRLFVDAADDLRLLRRLERDLRERGRTAESVMQQYLATVRPMHEQWVRPARRFAHLVVTNNGSPDELRAAALRIRRRLDVLSRKARGLSRKSVPPTPG